MVAATSPAFEGNARQALENAGLWKALAFGKPQSIAGRARAPDAPQPA